MAFRREPPAPAPLSARPAAGKAHCQRPPGTVLAEPLEPRRLLTAAAPDETFADAGRFFLDRRGYAVPAASHARAAAVQPDGKTLVAGVTSGVAAVLRFNPDGSPDPTFGDNGTAFPFAESLTTPARMEVMPDGRIVVAADAGPDHKWVARLHPDGSRDPSFDNDGIAIVAVHEGPTRALLVLPDGSVAVAGGMLDSWLLKLTPAGRPDESFNRTGVLVRDESAVWPDGNLHDFYASLALQPDGTLVVGGGNRLQLREGNVVLRRFAPDGSLRGGSTYDTGFTHDVLNALTALPDGTILAAAIGPGTERSPTIFLPRGTLLFLRFNPDGSPDTTFDNDGWINEAVPVNAFNPYAAIPRFGPDGRLVLASDGTRTRKVVMAVRYNTDGTFDSTFGSPFAEIPDAAAPTAAGLAIAPNGAVSVAANGAMASTVLPALAAVRFRPDSTPDTAFDSDGVAVARYHKARPLNLTSVAAAPGGKVLSGGWLGSSAFVARHNADGTPDPSFGNGDGWETFLPPAGGCANSITPLPDGKVLLAGNSGPDFLVMRLNADGSPDATFSPGGADGDGAVITDIPGGAMAFRVVVQPDGRIITAGFGGSPTFQIAMARYLPGGALDTTFGPGGGDGDGIVIARARPTGQTNLAGLAIAPDGAVVVAGVATSSGPAAFALFRFLPNGSPDPAFGTAGVLIDPARSPLPGSGELLVEADGRIVTAGSVRVPLGGKTPGFEVRTAVVRYLPDGSRDDAFGGPGGVVTLPAGAAYVSHLSRTPAGGYLVAGGSNTAGAAVFLATLRHDGAPDDAFLPAGYGFSDLGEAAATVLDLDVTSEGKFVLAAKTGDTADAEPARPTLARLVGFSPPPPGVAGRYLLDQNNSPGAARPGDGTPAPDKRPLLPGRAATFANYTNSVRGIAGVVIDLARQAPGPVLSAADFELHVGNGAAWASAPQATVTTAPGAGGAGTDRVTLAFIAGAVPNTWLRVTVNPGAATGLSRPDVFYFGNLAGDTGRAGAAAAVNAADVTATRQNLSNRSAAALARYDFNRDGVINAVDYAITRAARGRTLRLFTAPAAAAHAVVNSQVPPPPRATAPRRGDWETLASA